MMNYIITLLASMTPLVEFRMAIPVGVSLGLSVWESVGMAILGGLIATKLLLYFLPTVIEFVRKKWKWLDIKIGQFLEKKKKLHLKKMKNVGMLGMIFFVMLPIPGSGAYTSVLLAYIFQWPYKRSLIAISLGVILGSILIGVLTQSGLGLFHYLKTLF